MIAGVPWVLRIAALLVLGLLQGFAAVRYPYPQALLTEAHELTFRAGRRLPILQGDCP